MIRFFRGLALTALIVGLIPLVSSPLEATTLVSMDLNDLSAQAELVVLGWVTGVEVQRNESGRLYTYVTLDNLEIRHGAHTESTLTLRFLGGELDGERQWVAGMPRFSIGERSLLFVQGNGTAICPLVGWGQGRFQVRNNPGDGSEFLADGTGTPVIGLQEGRILYGKRQDGSGAPVTARSSAGTQADGGSPPAASAAPQTNLPWADFLAVVDQLRSSN